MYSFFLGFNNDYLPDHDGARERRKGASVSHRCDKPQGDMGRGMEGWGQGMKKSTHENPNLYGW